MNPLFGWQSLVFYVPVAFGALLAVGAAFGFVGDDGGDNGAHEHDGDPSSLLAVGRLPLTVRLMLAMLSFGGIGLVFAPLMGIVDLDPDLGGSLAVVVAIIGTLGVDRVATRWLARRMPLFESQIVRRDQLVGAMGRVVLTASERGGVAQVRDGRGDLHQVTCRLAAGEEALPPGTEILLIDYDARGEIYLGERAPFAGSEGD